MIQIHVEGQVEPGYRFPFVAVVARAVRDGDLLDGKPISNKRGNLWWATPEGLNSPEFICCFDGENHYTETLNASALILLDGKKDFYGQPDPNCT